MNSSCLIVGIGNPDRGDDGAGPLAADVLRRRAPEDTRIEVLRDDPAPLIEWLEQVDSAWFIDAAEGDESAGTIRCFDVAAGAVPETNRSISTHGLGLSETIELARALGALPHQCIAYSIQGKTFKEGAEISSEVRAAAGEVAERILMELQTCYSRKK